MSLTARLTSISSMVLTLALGGCGADVVNTTATVGQAQAAQIEAAKAQEAKIKATLDQVMKDSAKAASALEP